MSFRARLLLAFAPLVLIPLAVLAFGVRTVLNDRLNAQFEDRLAALAATIELDLERLSVELEKRAAAVGARASADNQFRLGTVSSGPERQYLLDYATHAMALSGLDALQIQDDEGVIVSSGHFRNQFGQRVPLWGRVLHRARFGVAIANVQTPTRGFDVIVRTDSFRLGNRSLHVTAGVDLGDLVGTWGRPGDDMAVTLADARGDDASDTRNGANALTASVSLHRLSGDSLSPEPERVVISHSLEPIRALQSQVDKWSILVFATAGTLTLAVTVLTAARLSRPLVDLADRTSSLDLDRLDVQFTSERRDEVGSLTRLLGAMVARLRTSASRLREAERRAAVGELARQINHDIKNGLVPIRNVVQHMTEVHQNDPDGLAAVFGERRATVDSSIAYLENLASQYAKLTPDRKAAACDMNEIIREAVQSMHVPDTCNLVVRSMPDLPRVRADRLALRRIIENIVGNAVDSLEGRKGDVTITTARAAGPEEESIELNVRDTGKGMDAPELERAFHDFHTTKPGGTGLGLSVVRRLVGDLGGSLRIDTEPARGTTVSVALPVVSEGRSS